MSAPRSPLLLAFLLLPLPLLLGSGCRARAEFTTPIPVDETFTLEPAAGAERARYVSAARYSEERAGAALLVLRGRTIVFEDYANGYRAETPLHVFSGTKSFWGVLAACAVGDGVLALDEPIAATLTELAGDPEQERVLVRHLLDFTSGWRDAFFRTTWDALHVPQRVEDKYADAVGRGLREPPGTSYRYGGAHLTLFGAFLQRKLGDPLAYLERRVLRPIGFRYAGWLRDPKGQPMLPFGAWTTAREWAKFGALLLAEGNWEGTQVVPQELLRQCFVGSELMPAYGLTFWLNRPVPEELADRLIPQLRDRAGEGPLIWPEGPTDLYAAAGHQGNRCYVIPSRGLVVVRLGFDTSDFDDAEFLARLLR